jgi:hypothetical protein
MRVKVGIDSGVRAGAVELRNTLEKHFNLSLPATFAFDYPTISDMSEFLAKHFTPGCAEPELSSSDAGMLLQCAYDDDLDCSAAVGVLALSSRHPRLSLGPHGFLHSLVASADLQRQAPLTRWDNESIYSPMLVPKRTTATTRFAAFCEDVEQFDAAAFRMSGLEALSIDPQTRQVCSSVAIVI